MAHDRLMQEKAGLEQSMGDLQHKLRDMNLKSSKADHLKVYMMKIKIVIENV